ncbi:MAG: cAMP-binding protein [Ignavibacteria bacterium]|nr:MAG: cAMP-binding protein [Ignavibacteria bacterium]KAF0161966.1 MAG: cAMP-binding protein [Ignavibacteria bacterium]
MSKEIFSKNSFWNNLFKTKTEKSNIEEVLLSMPPFHDLTITNLKAITKLMHNRIYHPNELIFHQGDPGTGLYIIISGQVVIRQEEEKNSWDLTKLSRGDFFGELALLDDERRSATAIALEETRVIVIFKPDLDAFIQNNPKEGIKILKGISQIIAIRLRSLNQDYFQLYKQMKKN